MRRIVGILVVCGVAAFLPLLAGCGSGGSGSATPDLEGTSWRLTGWSSTSQDPKDFTITAEFKGGSISGTSAVNTYSGPYKVGPKDQFSCGPLASTKMAGPEPDMQAETTYLQLLEGARSAGLSSSTLTLYAADGSESLVYTAK